MEVPFILAGNVTVAGNASGRITLPVSANEEMEIEAMFQKSTGAFDITGLTDSQGRQFSNASSGNPVDSDFIQDVATSNRGWYKFMVPVQLPGATSLYIDVKDTSGSSNTIELAFSAKRKYN